MKSAACKRYTVNNNLNATAHLVAECLPEARFLCLTRNRRDLAQSLFRARQEIHGAADQPYGLADSHRDGADPIESVCRQIEMFEQLAREQQDRLGERFQLVEYEAFCRDPATLDEAGVSRAAIESLAENFSDGVVAPAFWFAVLGLPGMLAYISDARAGTPPPHAPPPPPPPPPHLPKQHRKQRVVLRWHSNFAMDSRNWKRSKSHHDSLLPGYEALKHIEDREWA